MKNRKFLVLMTLVLAFSLLAGCGSDKEDVSGSITSTTSPIQDKNLSLGVVEGGTYTNAYAGIGCTLDGSWVIYPAEQLQELPATVRDMMEGSELAEAMADVEQFTDMFAENADSMINMNVLLQKQSMQERLAFAMLTEEQMVDGLLEQLDTLTEAYAQAGINVKSMEKVVVTFLGEERYAAKTTAESQGIPVYMLQLFDYTLGEYSVTITMTSFLEDNTASALELFYKLD